MVQFPLSFRLLKAQMRIKNMREWTLLLMTTRYRTQIIACLFIMLIGFNLPNVFAQKKRRGTDVIDLDEVRPEKLYKGSYALVIGVSEYSGGWNVLPGVAKDVPAIRSALEKHGFQVTTLPNLHPTKSEILGAIQQFISDYGYEYENRLLIYFAGHGHIEPSPDGRGDIGYIVPSDAPVPRKDVTGFKRKSISTDVVIGFATEIQAKHALFVFDSCFSGNIFSRAGIIIPRRILTEVKLPVRQFITSGAENQTVPDQSLFRVFFERGLLEGKADLNGDKFILGSELAEYLRDNVIKYGKGEYTPRYGKIRDAKLDRGDFVFALSQESKGCSTAKSTITGSFGMEFVCVPEGEFLMGSTEQEITTAVKEFMRLERLRDLPFPVGVDLKFLLKELGKDLDLNVLFDPVVFDRHPRLTFEVRNTTAAQAIDYILLQEGLTFIAASRDTILITTSERKKIVAESQPPAKKAYSSVIDLINDREKEPFLDETPKHKVTFNDGFYLGKYEVTQDQWKLVMGENPSKFNTCGGNCPVEKVSWIQIREFLDKLNAKKDGFEYRLPSEAEWEYAARAGTTTNFAFGGDLDRLRANFCPYYNCDERSNRTVPVGKYQPNNWGLFDMHGNVAEWCEDVYKSDYEGLPVDGTSNLNNGLLDMRVIRGGSWSESLLFQRSSSRSTGSSSVSSSTVGFRLVAVPQ